MCTPHSRSWCGALCGLALLVPFPVSADAPLRQAVREHLRDESYLLVEDRYGARLFVFTSGIATAVAAPKEPGDSRAALEKGLEMARSSDSRTRIRGLTLLSGADDPAALDAALVLLSDPVAAVREEAVQLIAEHPHADIDSIVAIASQDPSARVRGASRELIDERMDDGGD